MDNQEIVALLRKNYELLKALHKRYCSLNDRVRLLELDQEIPALRAGILEAEQHVDEQNRLG